MLTLTRASLVLVRPKKAGSPGRGAESALVRTVGVGEGCGDPLQNNVDGETPQNTTQNPFVIVMGVPGGRTWDCSSGSGGASVIAVDAAAYSAEGASGLKGIYQLIDGANGVEGRRQMMEAVCACRGVKGLKRTLISSLLESGVKVLLLHFTFPPEYLHRLFVLI
jgi:hypothetical protein